MDTSPIKKNQPDDYHTGRQHQGNRTVVSSPEITNHATSSPQWMQILKLVLILSSCVTLVYMALFYESQQLELSDAAMIWVLACIGILFCYWMTRMKQNAEKQGARWSNRLFGNKENEENTTEKEEHEGPETLLQMACGLEYVGEALTTIAAFAPAAIFALLLQAIGWNETINDGIFICICALITGGWLLYIQNSEWGGVRVTLPIPIVKIPLIWFVWPAFGVGLGVLFGWID